MFLRGNLARFGLGGGTHPHATRLWRLPAEGPIRAVLGLTNAGVVLCQIPGATPAEVAALAAALAGERATGLTGEAGQIAALLPALGLGPAAMRADSTEPLYRLTLADLPPGPASLRRPRPGDEPLLQDWFRGYFRGTGFAPTDPAEEAALCRDRAIEACADDSSCRLLLQDGRPVAMAALNAQVADLVQVGGVYVPEAARGRGLGREVTRALLAEARDRGARVAVLFANNPAAARAYEAIGFSRIGSYRIVFLSRPVLLDPCA